MFVIHRLGYGGAEKMLTLVANGLDDLGYTVYIYTYDDDAKHYILNKGIIHISAESPIKIRKIRRFLQIFQIRRMIQKVNPDAVISFLNYPNALCILATTLLTIPVIICERADPNWGTNYIERLRKFIYRFADGGVFQTEEARSCFTPVLRDKSCVIPNAITVPQNLKPASQRRNEIAFVGRFEMVQKRQDLMLLAFCKVVESHPEVKLVFYGDGPDESEVRNMAAKLNLSEKVVFAGFVNNIFESINESKMLVMTSDYEGIPNSLLEAMSLGLPVIATDCSPGGARMLIEHSVNGLLVPKGNVEAISEAILFFLENDQIAEECGRKAMEVQKTFAPENIITMWDMYIDNVLTK